MAKLIEIDGKTKCLTDWCKHFGISTGAYYHRVNRQNWDSIKALTYPVTKTERVEEKKNKSGYKLEYYGSYKCSQE